MRSACKIFFAFSYIFPSLMIIILNQYCIKYASKFHCLLYWSKLLIFDNAVKKAKHISGFAWSFVEIFIFAHVTQWLSCGIFWNSIRFHRLEYFFVFCFFSVWLPLNWNIHFNLLLVRSFHNHFIYFYTLNTLFNIRLGFESFSSENMREMNKSLWKWISRVRKVKFKG